MRREIDPLPQSTRFSVAVHILVSLSLSGRLNSEELAWSIDTNASMVRRILASLKKSGLVGSRAGPDGGAVIAKDPKRITLLEVLHAVELKPATGVHHPNPKCPLGAVIDVPLAALLAEADQAAEQVLDEKSVDDVARAVRRRIAQRARG